MQNSVTTSNHKLSFTKAGHTQSKFLYCNHGMQERILLDSLINTDSVDADMPPAGPLSSHSTRGGWRRPVIIASGYNSRKR